MRNPVYDIVPRHLCYNASQCGAPSDFVDGCCATPQYCCPHTRKTCAAPAPPEPKCRITARGELRGFYDASLGTVYTG